MYIYFRFFVRCLHRRALFLSVALLLSGIVAFLITLPLPIWQRAQTTILLATPSSSTACDAHFLAQKQVFTATALWKKVLHRLQAQFAFYEKKDTLWQPLFAKDLPFHLTFLPKQRGTQSTFWLLELDAHQFTWSLVDEKRTLTYLQRAFSFTQPSFDLDQFHGVLQLKKNEKIKHKRTFFIQWKSFRSIFPTYLAHFDLQALQTPAILQLTYVAPTNDEALSVLTLLLDEYQQFNNKNQVTTTQSFSVLQPLDTQTVHPPFYSLWCILWFFALLWVIILEKIRPYFLDRYDFQVRNILPDVSQSPHTNPFATLYFLSEKVNINLFVFTTFSAPTQKHFSVVLQAARAWTQRQQKVLLIDAHFDAPQFQRFIENEPLYTLRDYFAVQHLSALQLRLSYSAHIDLIYTENIDFPFSIDRFYKLIDFFRTRYDAILVYAPWQADAILPQSAGVLLADTQTSIAVYRRAAKQLYDTRNNKDFSLFLE